MIRRDGCDDSHSLLRELTLSSPRCPVAARLKRDLNLDTEIVEGRRGEFTVWVGDRKVAEKDWNGFPSDDAIVEAVRRAAGT